MLNVVQQVLRRFIIFEEEGKGERKFRVDKNTAYTTKFYEYVYNTPQIHTAWDNDYIAHTVCMCVQDKVT